MIDELAERSGAGRNASSWLSAAQGGEAEVGDRRFAAGTGVVGGFVGHRAVLRDPMVDLEKDWLGL